MKQTIRTYHDGRLIDTTEVDLPDPTSEQTIEATLRSSLAQTLDSLRAYIALSAPTGPQTIAIVKALCRVVIQLVRLTLRDLEGTD